MLLKCQEGLFNGILMGVYYYVTYANTEMMNCRCTAWTFLKQWGGIHRICIVYRKHKSIVCLTLPFMESTGCVVARVFVFLCKMNFCFQVFRQIPCRERPRPFQQR